MAWEKLGTASVSGTTANTSWKELDRVTLGSANSTIDTGTFTAKDNMMILTYDLGNTSNVTANGNRQFNSDTGSNYSSRRQSNGGSSTAQTSDSTLVQWDTGDQPSFSVETFTNIAAQEKLVLHHSVHQNTAGAGNAPMRNENYGKWANTSAQVTSYQVKSDQNFNTGSEIVVLGYDNDEADSGTNFWQELASVELSSSGDLIDTDTFTAKKYLMIEAVGYRVNDSVIPALRVGNGTLDTGSNYARRQSVNGGTDATVTSQTSIATTSGAGYLTKDIYFIVNKSDKEKLVINEGYVTGSGASTAGDRQEIVGKWANTSAQINRIGYLNVGGGTSDFGTGSYIKVYGAD